MNDKEIAKPVDAAKNPELEATSSSKPSLTDSHQAAGPPAEYPAMGNDQASVPETSDDQESDASASPDGLPTTDKTATKSKTHDRPPYLIIAALTALTVFAANGAWKLLGTQPLPITEEVEPVELLAEQVERVRAGESDTIELDSVIVTDEELESVKGLASLRILILDAGIITDDGLKVISTLNNLVHLRIRQSLITDAGIKNLVGLENLRVLNLPQANLTPDGMRSLSQLKRLRQLRIGGDGTTDLSRAVAQLTNVRALHLIDIPVSDEGLRAIAKMPRLESLYLDNARVTEVGWQWLFETHPELHIHINQRHHDIDPNWHVHDSESEVDDMENQGLIDPENQGIVNEQAESEKFKNSRIYK